MKNYDSYYHLEFQHIPGMAASYERGGHKLLILNNKDAWKKTLSALLPSVANGFDWNNLKIKTYGREGDSVIVVFYIFPEPFQVPLANYGAVVINHGKVTYYTSELSFGDCYVIGSMAEGGTHFNFGDGPKLTPQEFLEKICSFEKIHLPSETSVVEQESFWSKFKKLF